MYDTLTNIKYFLKKYFLYEIFRIIPEENMQQKTPLAFTKDVYFYYRLIILKYSLEVIL